MRPTRAAMLVAATVLTPALLFTAPAFAADTSTPTTPVTTTPATACPDVSTGTGTPVDELTDDQVRAEIQDILTDDDAGAGVLREANKALSGTAEDMRAFLETGCRLAQAEDDSVAVAHVLAVATQNGDKRVIKAANAALDANTPEALRAFLETGYAQAQVEDDSVAVAHILYVATQSGDKRVIAEANAALDAGTAEALSHFRWTGYRLAQAEDDRVYITHMLTDPNISDAMYDAIQAVLDDGSPEALRYFRTVGQYEIGS
ncbi:ALF repeat-containing protein [Streptomyces sp. NPDC048417]|uniref:ALF repeat-containing protein n=1 Tax=Streptomyces sp. NPDC048417 TaxID=3155387 RepID=UPI003412FB1A